MRRFRVKIKNKLYVFALVKTYSCKYKFVNLSEDELLRPKFKTVGEALKWLDESYKYWESF